MSIAAKDYFVKDNGELKIGTITASDVSKPIDVEWAIVKAQKYGSDEGIRILSPLYPEDEIHRGDYSKCGIHILIDGDSVNISVISRTDKIR